MRRAGQRWRGRVGDIAPGTAIAIEHGGARGRRGRRRGTAGTGIAALLAIAAATLFALPAARTPTAPPHPAPATPQPLDRGFGELPISFQPNRGQSARAVRFLAAGTGYGLFLTDRGAVLSLAGAPPLAMTLAGAEPRPRILAERRLPGSVNYLSAEASRTGIPTYGAVRYADVWPGIGVRFYGNERRLEYDFLLAPRADPDGIGLRFRGQSGMRIEPGGALVVRLGDRSVRQPPPRAFQTVGDERQAVPSRYVIRGERVGIALGPYDRGRALVIDPQLVYSSYIGRGIDGRGYAIAVEDGSAYITGYTTSPRFPTTPGARGSKRSREAIAFVAKLNRAGNRLAYSTFLGGRAGSEGYAIAVDRRGSAYVAGLAYEPDFPTTAGAYQPTAPGFQNGFVAKLSPDGRRLLYSTYVGSPGEDGGHLGAIDVDRAGNAYVAGYTFSSILPTTPGAPQPTSPGGGTDGFVAKLNPSGSALLYSTYLGGSGEDTANGIAVDAAGSAYVTGATDSHDFPVTPGALQAQNLAENEFSNAFVTKLDPSGTAFAYSTYLGGHSLDAGIDVAVDRRGAAHVTGEAGSDDFPTTPGAFQRRLRGFDAAFLATLSPGGDRLLHSTLLGGGPETGARGRGIALDRAGNAYVAGLTEAHDFPLTRGAVQRRNRSPRGYNGFFAKLNPSLTKLLYSTYLGGSRSRVAGVAVEGGAAYLTGGTGPGFPTRHGLQQPRGPITFDYPNAFVAKIRP